MVEFEMMREILARRRTIFSLFHTAVLACGFGCMDLASAQPQDLYPSKPIRVVVPYPPGGSTDIAARLVFQRVAEIIKQPVFIDNKSGGGGNIGALEVARSAPDGYTLLVATTQHAINMTLITNMRYDVRKSFAPISPISEGPLLLVTGNSQPFRNVKDVIEAAKSGKVTFATAGNGGSVHLAGELFNRMANVKMVPIPFRGSMPALTDVMSGEVTVMIDSMLSSMPFVTSGKLKALAITSPTRSKLLPSVPTVAESGMPGYEVTAWNGVLAPAGTPPPIVARLNSALTVVLQSAEVKERFKTLGSYRNQTLLMDSEYF